MSDVASQSGVEPIRHRLESLPISFWHALLFVVCALTLLCDSADQFLIISIAPLLIHEWNITSVDIGLIVGATGVGGIIGAPFFGFLADRIGRRRCMALAVFIYSVLTGLSALSANVTELIVIRALAGVGIGGIVPVGLAYVSEYSPPKWRGRIVAWWNSMFAFGIALAGAVGLTVIVPYGWRWGFVVGGAPILLIPLILWLPESVRYLVARGRESEAATTIERVERAVLGAKKAAAIATQHDSGTGNSKVSMPTEPPVTGWRALSAMNVPGIRGSMVASAVLWFVPAAMILSSFYGVFLTQSKGMELRAAIAVVTATALFGPLGQFTAGLLSDWVGRKTTLALGLLLFGTMPLAAFSLVTSEAAIYVCLSLSWIGMAAAYGTAFGYTAEQLPTELRAGGLGIFEGLRRTGTAVGPVVVGVLFAQFGLTPVLWITLGGCLLTLFVVLALGRETRGQSMTEWQALSGAASSKPTPVAVIAEPLRRARSI